MLLAGAAAEVEVHLLAVMVIHQAQVQAKEIKVELLSILVAEAAVAVVVLAQLVEMRQTMAVLVAMVRQILFQVQQ